jgi:hypothetical protein
MSADYLPVHDPAVHGPAYAAKRQGQDTHPFAAVRPYVQQPCRCDYHKYGQPPGTDAVLYAGPDVVHLLERAAIRDGRYVDARAYANHVLATLHAKCEAADLQTRLTLEPAWQALQRWRQAEDARRVA